MIWSLFAFWFYQKLWSTRSQFPIESLIINNLNKCSPSSVSMSISYLLSKRQLPQLVINLLVEANFILYSLCYLLGVGMIMFCFWQVLTLLLFIYLENLVRGPLFYYDLKKNIKNDNLQETK